MTTFTPQTLLRRAVQFAFLCASLLAGLQLYRYCLWAAGISASPAMRPEGTEAFLPISALLGLKRLVLAGEFDPVHPAGLTILLAAFLLAFLLRRGFCAFACPVGLVSDLLAGLGRRLGLSRTPPRRLDRTLRALKFVILALALAPFLSMGLDELRAFSTSSFNVAADVHLLRFFLDPSRLTLCIIAGLAALGLFVRNAWCRWLCPYGACLGLLAVAGPLSVKRDDATCTKCGRCERACPSAIAIREKTAMSGPECMGCAQCIGACPVEGTLCLTAAGRRLPWYTTGLGVFALFIAFCLAAGALGLWHSRLPEAMLRAFYARAFLGL